MEPIKNKKSDRSKIENDHAGTLYVVSTPIGNLEDITLRALRILKSVDLIAAENVKHSKGLCQHYGINTRITSYHQHNRTVKGPELMRRLKRGLNIALVTNAGTPAVSDPGNHLINQALEENVRVSPIPGPSAVVTALSASGLRGDRFLFLGFLPNKAGKRRKELKNLQNEFRTMVFFEAPHRIHALLKDLYEILGDRNMVLLRELTKVYEEIKRGSVISILEGLKGEKSKGEFTLVVEGRNNIKDVQTLDIKTKKEIETLMKKKRMGVREIAQELSHKEGLTYRTIYKECLSIKKSISSSNETI
jgi:16S rRNA (cytidine1402-2'-O)-methyltransferase